MSLGNYELVIDEVRSALAACEGLYFFCPSSREQVATIIDFIGDLPTEAGAVIVVVHRRQEPKPENESPHNCNPPT